MEQLQKLAKSVKGKVMVYRDNCINVVLPNNFYVMTPAKPSMFNNNVEVATKLLKEYIADEKGKKKKKKKKKLKIVDKKEEN